MYSLVVCCAAVWRDGGEGGVVAAGAVGRVPAQSAPNIQTRTHFIYKNRVSLTHFRTKWTES